eukprot:Tamp_23821.p1 GENE.Tamp_23821~~Tamp_23821.p1  ORF type:complete len:265 (-),score=37.38 Tamp_23821:225-992(-)
MVNWTRQFGILIMAAIFAIYWTGKQGLWDALKGSSSIDRDWADAKQALMRRLPPKYEVVDGVNQRQQKRLLVLAPPPERPVTGDVSKDGGGVTDSTPPPQVIAAELIPAIKEPRSKKKNNRDRGRDRDRGSNRWKKDKKSKEKTPFGKKDRRDRRRGGREEPEREAVAKLRIHDTALNYLKDMFGPNALMRQDSLIQSNEDEDHATNPANPAISSPGGDGGGAGGDGGRGRGDKWAGHRDDREAHGGEDHDHDEF